MNIANVTGINNVQNLKSTSFKNNSVYTCPKDSFERSEIITDNPISYPKTTSYNFTRNKRTRTIEEQENILKAKMRQKAAEQQEAKLEFARPYSKVIEIIDEINDKMSGSPYSIEKINSLLNSGSLSEFEQEGYKKLRSGLTDEIKALIEEYEILQNQLDEFFESGKGDQAGISDIRIKLPQDNIDFYKNLSD